MNEQAQFAMLAANPIETTDHKITMLKSETKKLFESMKHIMQGQAL